MLEIIMVIPIINESACGSRLVDIFFAVMSFSIASNRPTVWYVIAGTITMAKTINAPCSKSVQHTARKPPRKVYATMISPPTITALWYVTPNVDSNNNPDATRPDEAYIAKNANMIMTETILDIPVGSLKRSSKKQGSVMVFVFCLF